MMQIPIDPPPAATPPGIDIDPLSLLLHASGPVRVVNWALILAAASVWIVALLKGLELARYRTSEKLFEAEAAQASTPEQLFGVARAHASAPGARIVLALGQAGAGDDLLAAQARRAFVLEEQRIGALLTILSTIGSAGPFVGLFGTVWGILDAFLRIGREKSASLPVVAPAIGEALIATAVGLFAAIPAVIAFNILSKRADDLLARIEAASDTWIAVVKRHDEPPANRRAPLDRPVGDLHFPAPARPAGG